MEKSRSKRRTTDFSSRQYFAETIWSKFLSQYKQRAREVLFDPVSGKGTYYIYYLPYELKASENYPQAVYLKKTVSGTSDVKGSEVAKFVRIDAVDRFNENNPMEVLVSKMR